MTNCYIHSKLGNPGKKVLREKSITKRHPNKDGLKIRIYAKAQKENIMKNANNNKKPKYTIEANQSQR